MDGYIDTTASISATANIGPNVTIGKHVIVRDNVEIGEGTIIGDYTIINKNTIIGKYNQIGNFCSIGCDPTNRGFDMNTSTGVKIGDHNLILDYAVVTRATIKDQYTELGNSNIIASHVYIGHDCILKNNIFISTKAAVAGFCTVGNNTTIGVNSFIHQVTTIGNYCMIGACAKIVRDVPSFLLADGIPADIKKLNYVGLERNGLGDLAEKLSQLYFELYVTKDIEAAKMISQDNEMLQNIIGEFQNTRRGVTYASKKFLPDYEKN